MDVEVLGLEDFEVEFVVLDLVLAELSGCGCGEDETGERGEDEGVLARSDPPDEFARRSERRRVSPALEQGQRPGSPGFETPAREAGLIPVPTEPLDQRVRQSRSRS
jgi:hypothetical protein